MTNKKDEYAAELTIWLFETLGLGNVDNPFGGSDWLLIIKLHAMIEAALNSSLLKQFCAPELEKVISKLDTSNSSTGKVAFATALKILTKQSAAFLQKLSELRNKCVHDIRNFSFNLTEYLAQLPVEDRNNFVTVVSKELKDEPDDSGKVITAKEFASDDPRRGLLLASMNIMMQIHAHHIRCEARDLLTRNPRR